MRAEGDRYETCDVYELDQGQKKQKNPNEAENVEKQQFLQKQV
jgi:hypothetical protein